MLFRILGTEFSFNVDDPRLATFVSAFQGAYVHLQRAYRSGRHFQVELRAGSWDLTGTELLREVAVHRHGTMPYWDFSARVFRGTAGAVFHFPERGLWLSFDLEAQVVRMRYEQRNHYNFVSETAFHLCRSLALYLRPKGALWHGSAVSSNGRALLFCGNSQSGKTTLLLESIQRLGALPISNDRVFLPHDAPGRVVSWPGYISLCEGTILQHPALREGALKYEQADCAYRTAQYGLELRPVFHKAVGTKRMYPMLWLWQCLDSPYLETAQLGVVIFPRLAPGLGSPRQRELDFERDHAELLSRLREVSFDGAEDAFLPWHGLAATPAVPLAEQLEILRQAGVRLFSLELGTERLQEVGGVLRELTTKLASAEAAPPRAALVGER